MDTALQHLYDCFRISLKSEKVKIAIFLHALGEEALEVYNLLSIEPEGENETMQDIVTALEKYCLPRKNVVFERHQFWAYPMPDSITIDKYVTELKQKSKDCECGSTESDMIRDKIVLSISDQCLKERLLRETNLTLEKKSGHLDISKNTDPSNGRTE